MASSQMFENVISVISKGAEERRPPEIEVILPWLRKKSELLNGIENGVLVEIIRRCQYHVYHRDDIVIKQGDIGDCFYIMLTGRTSVYIDPKTDDAADDKESSKSPTHVAAAKLGLVINLDDFSVPGKTKPKKKKLDRTTLGKFIMNFEAGKSFGEIALMSDNSVRNASIVADEDSDLLIVHRELFNSTLKAKQEEEYAERKMFILQCPVFRGWREAIRRLCEMSLRKETLPFESIIVQQGEPVAGLHFIIRGQAKIKMEPHRHTSQFPNLFKKENILVASGLAKETNKEEYIKENVTQENIRVRRQEGYAAAEKRISTKVVDVCTVEDYEVIGDVEMVMKMPTYMQTVKCTANTEVFILDMKNIERLFKKQPQTVEILKKIVEEKIKMRMTSVSGQNIPLLHWINQKIQLSKPKVKGVAKDQTEAERSQDIFMKRLVRLFLQDKVPLLKPYVPDAIHYRYKTNLNQMRQPTDTEPRQSFRMLDPELRLQRARIPKRKVKSRRELQNMKVSTSVVAEAKKSMGQNRSHAMLAMGSDNQSMEPRGEKRNITVDGSPWTPGSVQPISAARSAFITTVPGGDSFPIKDAWQDIEQVQRSRSASKAKIVCSISTNLPRSGSRSVATSRPKSAPNVSSRQDVSDDEYFDHETSNQVLSSVEEKLQMFYDKFESNRREKFSVSTLKRFELQNASNIPVPGGTVLVKQKLCKFPKGVYIDANSHQHVRRFMIPKRSTGLADPVRASRPIMVAAGSTNSVYSQDSDSGTEYGSHSTYVRPHTAFA